MACHIHGNNCITAKVHGPHACANMHINVIYLGLYDILSNLRMRIEYRRHTLCLFS